MDSYYQRNQKPHHEHHRRKLHLKLIISLIILIYCGYCLFRPLPAISVSIPQATASHKTAQPELNWPVSAESAVGSLSDGLLATSSDSQKMTPTASVAKLITALTVLDKFPLSVNQQGPTITLGEADMQIFNKYYAKNGSLVNIQVGEEITEQQALEAMLLPSANNMADSLAIWAYGSLDDYRANAQRFVKTLGMDHTVIGADASGFDPGTKSTPSDLIKLAQAALKNPLIRQIVAEQTATVPVAGVVHNTNYLLGTSGIIGIKTGNSEEAGGNLLVAATYPVGGQKTTVIAAILGAPKLVDAMRAATPLLASAEKAFQLKPVVKAGQTVASFEVPWLSQPLPVVAQQNISIPVWADQLPKPTITTDNYKPPRLINSPFSTITAGTKVGQISFGTDGGRETSQLVVSQQIDGPSVFWCLTHPF